MSDNKLSCSNDQIPHCFLSPDKQNSNNKYQSNTKLYKHNLLTSPNLTVKKAKKSKSGLSFKQQINLKKKPKNLSALDPFNDFYSPIGNAYKYYPYNTFHNKCVSLIEKAEKKIPIMLKESHQEAEFQVLNKNNFPKTIQIQQNNPYMFWDKKSNSNSTNVTSIKDQLSSDYNDLSLMLGSRLNFKYKTKFNNISNILKRETNALNSKKDSNTKLPGRKKNVKKCLSNEIKTDNIILKNDESNDDTNITQKFNSKKVPNQKILLTEKSLINTNDSNNYKGLSETDSDCNNEIIKKYFIKDEDDKNPSQDESVVNSISSKDEVNNITEKEVNTNRLSLFHFKAKNKIFSKQLSRISEISLRQSKDNDSISNIDLNSPFLLDITHTLNTERSQNLHLKNKLININEILSNQNIQENNSLSKTNHKRPLSSKSISRTGTLLSKVNQPVTKRSDNDIIRKVKIHLRMNAKFNRNHTTHFDFSSVMASSSSVSSDIGGIQRCRTKSYNELSFYSIFSPNNLKRKRTSISSLAFEMKTLNTIVQNPIDYSLNESLIKKQEKFIDKITPSFDGDKEEKLLKDKDYFISKSVNAVTKYLADIVDFDPENSVFEHGEIKTKAYFKGIKHSKVKSKEDVFLYYFHYSYNFFKKDNRYPIPKTITPTTSFEIDRSECMFIRRNSIYDSFKSYLLEIAFPVNAEINEYVLASKSFGHDARRHKKCSLFSNFSVKGNHKTAREKLLEMRKVMTQRLMDRDRTLLINPMNVLQNSYFMSKDMLFIDSVPMIIHNIKKVYKNKLNFHTTKLRENKLSLFLGGKKKNGFPETEYKIKRYRKYKTSDQSFSQYKYNPPKENNKFNENEFNQKMSKIFAERAKSTVNLEEPESPNNLFLYKQNELFQQNNHVSHKIQLTTQFNKSDIPQKESVLLRTHEIKNDIINNFNTVEESIIFHIKDGNYHNFLELMTKYKIDPETCDEKGNTLLILAVNSNSKEIVDYLVKRDFNINAVNHNGNSPLHYAISHRNYELVDYLIKNGADEKLKNCDGITPWQCLKNGLALN